MDATCPNPSPWRSWGAWLPLLMSGTALALLGAYLATGPHPPNLIVEDGVTRKDEGAVAHLWQLLMVMQLPVMGWFALNWLPREPRRAAVVLAAQALAIVAAALPVYLLEH